MASTEMDEGYRLLAAKYVRKQARRLGKQLDGVRTAEDIEYVHQARVASRRLRAALRMCDGCFRPKQVKRWRKQIRLITRSLGDARDKDVQIEFLVGVLSSVVEKKSFLGIARLLGQLERQRERAQPDVLRAADRFEASGVLKQMRKVAGKAVRRAKGRNVSVRSPCAREQTRQHILERLDELRSYEDSLADPTDQQRHHAMRIASKRLRYTVEIARPVYEGRLDATLEAAKKVQTLLGDVHDCDVWIEHLEAFRNKQRKRLRKRYGHAGPLARLEPGIDYLRRERAADRRQIFEALVQCWEELRERGMWEELERIVQERPRPEEKAPAVPEPSDAEGASVGVRSVDEQPEPPPHGDGR